MSFTNSSRSAAISALALNFFLCYGCKSIQADLKLDDDNDSVLSQRSDSDAKFTEIARLVLPFQETTIFARIEKSKNSGDAPHSRLVVENSDRRVLLSEESDDEPISIYTRSLGGDVGDSLVVNWEAGSASRIEVFLPESSNVRRVLDEKYRVDASFLILNGSDAPDIYITTAENGAGPFYTTRFRWNGERFMPNGKIPYRVFENSLSKAFAK